MSAAWGDTGEMETQPPQTAATAMSPFPGLTTDLFSEDRCDVGRPGHSLVYCSLPVGHGSNHQGATREGECHVWA